MSISNGYYFTDRSGSEAPLALPKTLKGSEQYERGTIARYHCKDGYTLSSFHGQVKWGQKSRIYSRSVLITVLLPRSRRFTVAFRLASGHPKCHRSASAGNSIRTTVSLNVVAVRNVSNPIYEWFNLFSYAETRQNAPFCLP